MKFYQNDNDLYDEHSENYEIKNAIEKFTLNYDRNSHLKAIIFPYEDNYRRNSNSCSRNDDCNEDEYCDSGYCCRNLHQFDRSSQQCIPCPSGPGDPCTNCCASSFLTCYENHCICFNNRTTDSGQVICPIANDSSDFITASQIALTAALVMGIAALIMILFKLCTKPRFLSIRHRSAAEYFSHSYITQRGNTTVLNRSSLSSLQIYVLSRLRDRPPSYNSTGNRRNHSNRSTRINNNNNGSSNSSFGENRPDEIRTLSQTVDFQSRDVCDFEPPPPYDGLQDERSQQLLPPPYNQLSNSEIILTPIGIINPAYVRDSPVNSIPSISATNEKDILKTYTR